VLLLVSQLFDFFPGLQQSGISRFSTILIYSLALNDFLVQFIFGWMAIQQLEGALFLVM
jgi:hypothetical protein